MQVVHKTIPTKSRRICSVPQCSNYCTKDISLHSFPKDPKLCKKWKDALRIGKPISKFMNVCSQHFLESDFMPKNVMAPHTILKRLKKGVVPSQKIPVRQHDLSPRMQKGDRKCKDHSVSYQEISLRIMGSSIPYGVVGTNHKKCHSRKPDQIDWYIIQRII